MLYFGYASNMNLAQMAERLRRAVTGTVARLPGFRLVFNKPTGQDAHAYANIVAEPSELVLGVVYEVSEAELALLDGFEGGGYRRVTVRVESGDDGFDAIAYVADPDRVRPGLVPSDEYLGRILTGAEQHGLPEDYVASIRHEAGRH